jgi:FtsZ-binding cell division protein ZapB
VSEQELKDEIQALRRQVRELQHERDGWKRKHQSLQATVRVFLRRMRDGDAVADEELVGLLSEK